MPRIAVILPCYNEAATIADVVRDFRRALPEATVYVYDNNSSDGTARLAAEAGAEVRHERRQGKGHVVRRMFTDVDADVYVMADGDSTYDAGVAPEMVRRLVAEQLDMVTGTRLDSEGKDLFRQGHYAGNRMLSGAVALLFGEGCGDLLSGYRVLSRRFVKSFPALSSGFETETEFTVHALELGLPTGDVPTTYRARPAGSASKLRTWSDGTRILWMILMLFKELRPFRFFFIGFLGLAALSIGMAWPVFVTFIETGLVPRFPTAIAATGCMTLAFLSLTCAFILDSVSRGRREMKRLHYLAIPPPSPAEALRR